MSGIGTEQLIFNPVRRDHSGLYRCSANNGLPRPIERLFEIDVLCKYHTHTHVYGIHCLHIQCVLNIHTIGLKKKNKILILS